MIKNETFNGAREFPVAGHYFELLSTVNPVTVEAYAAGGGRRLHFEQNVETGFFIDRRGLEGFDLLVITTSANEAVEFVYSDAIVGTRGSVDISDRASRVLGKMAARAHTMQSKTATTPESEMLAANSARSYLSVQNQSATEDAYVTTDGDAAAVNGTSFRIGPGETWTPAVVPTGAIRMIRGAAADVTLNVIEAS